MEFSKTQSPKMIKSGEFLTDTSDMTSAIDNFVNFLFKMGKSYLKQLNNIDTKKIIRIIRTIFVYL